ncbi:hypothetical protein HK102_005710, partial [Quaeritorhiza haematococci]
MAIHHATDGQGMEIWDEFSRRAGPYDRRDLEYQWDSFKNGSGITIGSLIFWAKEDSKETREEKKRLKVEEEKEQKMMKSEEALRREAVKFGVHHTGGNFEGWNAEKSVAVIKNTMHQPDHHVECMFSRNGAYQQCTECEWRNPFIGQLMIPQMDYPALHQQFFNITINNTVNNYNNNNTELELWDDEAHLADDYQPFDDPELSRAFKKAFSGIDSDFGRFVYCLNFGTVVSSGEDKTQWFKLNGFHWEQVEAAQIKELMDPETEGCLFHDKLRDARKWYLNNKNTKLANQIFKVKNNVKTDAFIDRVIRRTCARLFSKGYKDLVRNLDKNKDLLAFNNGVYDLNKGEFREGRADDYISKSVGYDYIPGCKDHRAELDDFFAKLFPDDELRDYVLRYLASCLSGNTRDQMIFFGYGSGRNGKSKLLALMKETLGPDYASTTDKGVVIGQQRPDANAVTHALNMLKGKRFAYISETVEGSKINESAFKAMSGEDCMFSRELYKQGQEIKPEFKLFMVCNHLPKFNAADDAMVRRIAVIPFQSKFVHPKEMKGQPNVFPVDTSLDDAKMRSWKTTFMSMLLEQYPEYQRRGIADKPALVTAMTSGYLAENDAAKAFLQMECETVSVEDNTHWIGPRDFYGIFKTWCSQNGFPSAGRWDEKKCWESFKDHVVKERSRKGDKNTQYIKDDLTENERALLDLDLVERLKEVAKHVKKLRADRAVDRQSWIEVGMAIHHATDGQGMELWDEFSRRAGPYDRRTLEYQWDSFKNGSGITIGSLIHWAKEDSQAARD